MWLVHLKRCVCAGFREVLCFWRYSNAAMSPSIAVSAYRRGPTRYGSDEARQGDARKRWSMSGRQTSKTEQICLASTVSVGHRSRFRSSVRGEVEILWLLSSPGSFWWHVFSASLGCYRDFLRRGKNAFVGNELPEIDGVRIKQCPLLRNYMML